MNQSDSLLHNPQYLQYIYRAKCYWQIERAIWKAKDTKHKQSLLTVSTHTYKLCLQCNSPCSKHKLSLQEVMMK